MNKMKPNEILSILIEIIPNPTLITYYELMDDNNEILFDWRAEKYRFKIKHNSFDQMINGKPERTNSAVLLKTLWENRL